MNRKRTKAYPAVIFLLVLACAARVPCFASDGPYMNIKTLAEKTAARWQDEYKSVRGKTVSVDCSVTVPKADMAPVLRVIWYPPLDPAFIKEIGSPAKADMYKYAARSDEDTTVFCYNFANTIQRKEIEKCSFACKYVSLMDLDWDKAYAYNSTLTAREAFDIIQNRAKEIYTKYGRYGYYPMEPAGSLTAMCLTDKDGNPVRDIGAYSFDADEMLRGLPVLGNIHLNYGFAENNKFESHYEAQYYILNVESQYAYGFAAHLLAEEELIQEDIPLVDFETGKTQIERLIEGGRVRKVYDVRLGYILYLEPDHNREHFRLIPSWVVDCEYYPSAKDETVVTDVPDYHAGQYFRKLVINAQTGKLYDPEDKSLERCDYPDIITWDQVKYD